MKKLVKLVKKEEKIGPKALEEYFMSKEIALNMRFALSKFGPGRIFTRENIEKVEEMRVEYKYLLKNLSKNDIKDMLDRFVANFTYDSNAIEGNSLTLKDVGMVLFENKVIAGKDLREIYETKNSRKVAEDIFNGKFKIDHESIIKMHKMLMKDIDERTGYKTFPNYIFGRQIKTTPPEKVRKDMDSLISFYKESHNMIHPLKVAATFHGRFEGIHPFADGNGRVGRFLINAILVDRGYPPITIRKTRRVAYMSSLEAFDLGKKDRLERFMIDRYKETFRKFFEVYVKSS
ncbi:MAG: Fic family protein [Candidatus Micrarchaeales archaeon]